MPLKILNGADLNNQRITSLGSPSAATDAVNRQYVDDRLAGLSWKQPVRVATTTNGALSTAYANGQVIDGYTLVTGDRILIKDQTTGADNGIYIVAPSGAPARAVDADSTAELQNASTYVVQGSVNADKSFTQTANDPTVGTTTLVWAQVGGSGGTTYTNGAGITISGSTISVDPAIVARKYATNSVVATAGTATTYTHNLGTLDVDVNVVEVSSGQQVFMDAIATSANTITLTSGAAVAAGQYRVIVQA